MRGWRRQALRALLPGLLGLQVAVTTPANGMPGGASPSRNPGVYDPRPDHLWNRIYRHLYVRIASDGKEFSDGIDPLLWGMTRYLLEGPSHQEALKLLDEFLATGAERLVADPVKRAMMQHDLLAVFDWTASRSENRTPECLALQTRLGQVIRRLALGRDDIQRLPDTYAQAVVSRAFADRYRSDRPGQPFLPNDLLQKDGSWVCLRNSAVRPLAITHFESFAGRSAFLVFMRLPQGRQATLDYLKRLQDHGNSWTPALRAPGQPLPDPRPPQFPAGTAVALARRAMVVDNQGDLVPTPLMETVQFRVYCSILAGHPVQDFYEFKLERSRLFSADRASLQPLPRDAREFVLFMAQGFDPFEVRPGSRPAGARPDPVFDRCDGCHQQPGIHSVMSYRQSELLSESSPEEETSVNAYAKRRRYDWGLLQGIWQSAAGEGGAE